MKLWLDVSTRNMQLRIARQVVIDELCLTLILAVQANDSQECAQDAEIRLVLVKSGKNATSNPSNLKSLIIAVLVGHS